METRNKIRLVQYAVRNGMITQAIQYIDQIIVELESYPKSYKDSCDQIYLSSLKVRLQIIKR